MRESADGMVAWRQTIHADVTLCPDTRMGPIEGFVTVLRQLCMQLACCPNPWASVPTIWGATNG